MPKDSLQQQCELGQQLLMETRYLEAIEVLAAAEQTAWDQRDFDTLARLYMPLQEAHRQKRQRCGEGIVDLGIIANTPDEQLDPEKILAEIPHGQLLVAGWKTIEPAQRVRELAKQRRMYVETFLAMVLPGDGANEVAAVPLADSSRALTFPALQFKSTRRHGNTETFGQVMQIWEQLHLPFLRSADAQSDPIARMQGYRQTIQVDPGCELAHQKLSDLAKQLSRGGM